MNNQAYKIKRYKAMLRIRRVEEKIISLWHEKKINSLMHLSVGQEAVAVGVCDALTLNDSVVSTHRCHAHYLAKGGNLGAMLAELAGKPYGCCGGRGGSMHLLDPLIGINLAVPIVGGSIPIAVGIGLSIKLKGENRISVAFFGDGAIEEGVFWESLNFASVYKLPVLFVCENNLYATHSHILTRQPFEDIADRISPHGVFVNTVDGNDVELVFETAKKMTDSIRNGLGPGFIEAKTYRLKEHWGPNEDWHLGYRSREEAHVWLEKCPLKQAKKSIGNNVNYPAIDNQINSEIEKALNLVFSEDSDETKN